MKDVNSGNFGLIIAYLLPGFVALWGLANFSDYVRAWLAVDAKTAPTVGGFLFGMLAAVGAGLVVNAFRWHLIDPLHIATGVPAKNWDYSNLPERVEPFRYLVSHQFRYYECYANLMVAIAFAFAANVGVAGKMTGPTVVAFAAVQLVLWSASRRTLMNYHQRVASFLGNQAPECAEPAESNGLIDPSRPRWYIRSVVFPHRGTVGPFQNKENTAA